jgi:hypothetical protein
MMPISGLRHQHWPWNIMSAIEPWPWVGKKERESSAIGRRNDGENKMASRWKMSGGLK